MKNFIMTYQGNNDELFVKKSTDGLDPDAKVVVPETHNAILLKDGQIKLNKKEIEEFKKLEN